MVTDEHELPVVIPRGPELLEQPTEDGGVEVDGGVVVAHGLGQKQEGPVEIGGDLELTRVEAHGEADRGVGEESVGLVEDLAELVDVEVVIAQHQASRRPARMSEQPVTTSAGMSHRARPSPAVALGRAAPRT